MAIADLILRYVEILLSWPVITLVLGLVALCWLHRPLADFLRRSIEVEGYGIRVKAGDPSQQRKEAQEAIQPQSKDAILAWVKENPDRVVADYQRLFNGYWFERALNLWASFLRLPSHLPHYPWTPRTSRESQYCRDSSGPKLH